MLHILNNFTTAMGLSNAIGFVSLKPSVVVKSLLLPIHSVETQNFASLHSNQLCVS
jgi:hypothetical protein